MYMIAVDTRSPMPSALYKLTDTGMGYPAIWGETVEQVESMTEEGKDFSPIKSIVFRNDYLESEKTMTAEEVFRASRPDEEGGYEPIEVIHEKVIGFRPDSVVIEVEGGQIVFKTMSA